MSWPEKAGKNFMSLENRLAEIEKKISAERFFVWCRIKCVVFGGGVF